MEAHNNYTDDKEVFQYFHETLQPAGFTNGKGKQIMSIDAWSGLSSNDEKYLIAQADTSELMVGCYGNPFCLWWDTKDTTCLNQTYYSSSLSSYKAKEVVLRANGKPIVYDGAYCLDPTHPAVKAQSASWIRSQINKGYRYFKLDFVTNGIMEADRYYNPEVHTGVEAYNEGFAYFVKQVDKFDVPVFIDLSIAPLFPYHYANGRRQACDTWGTIGWTEYSMNAITAGWWTNGLYQYNDPDGLPMVGHGDQGSTTLAENRSRLTNGIVSGHVLLADNFSVTNSSGRGNPELSRTRANSLFTNADINAMLALDPNFRPVYGYNEYNGSSSGAEATVMMITDEYFYVVVFNYNSSVNAANITGTIPLDILGFTKEDFRQDITAFNRTMRKKGIRIIPLKVSDTCALIYLYRPDMLDKDLKDPVAVNILKRFGYSISSPDRCVVDLVRRLNSSPVFPHEIGLFLGYPPSDVDGFINNPNEGFCAVGYWKVYSNADEAIRVFERSTKCTEEYGRMLNSGRTLEQLVV